MMIYFAGKTEARTPIGANNNNVNLQIYLDVMLPFSYLMVTAPVTAD